MTKDKNSYFTLALTLLPFLYQYKSPISVVSFGEFILIPFVLYYLANFQWRKVNFKNYYGYYGYIFAVLFATIMASFQEYFQISEFLTIFVRIIFYSLLIFVSYGNVDVPKAMKWLRNFSVLFSLYAILQFTVYTSTGVILPTVLNKAWIFTAEAGNRLDYAQYYRYVYRSSSLFLEPSYFALFAGAGLTSSLFYQRNSTSAKSYGFWVGILITVGMVVSTSSAALLLIILNWFGYVYKSFFVEKKRITYRKLMMVIILCVTLAILFTSSLSATLLTRTQAGGSFSNRITRGFLLVKEANIFQHLFGVGINNIASFMHFKNITTPYDESNLNYISSGIGTYLCSGIFSFIFYLRMYFLAWTSSKSALEKVLIVSLLIFSFIEANSFSYRFAFLFIPIINASFVRENNFPKSDIVIFPETESCQ